MQNHQRKQPKQLRTEVTGSSPSFCKTEQIYGLSLSPTQKLLLQERQKNLPGRKEVRVFTNMQVVHVSLSSPNLKVIYVTFTNRTRGHTQERLAGKAEGQISADEKRLDYFSGLDQT